MVFNKEDKTLAQLKSERRKAHKSSLIDKIISPSLKSGKNGISQIAVIIEAKKGVDTEINTNDNQVIENIDNIELDMSYDYNINKSEASDQFSNSRNGYNLQNENFNSTETEVDFDNSITKSTLNKSTNVTNNHKVIEQNSVNTEMRPQNEVLLPISLRNQMIDSGQQSDESKKRMTSNGKIGDEEIEQTVGNKNRFRVMKGLALSFISALFFSITTVIVKYVNDVHPGEMAFFRFLGILLFTLPLLMELHQNPFGPSNLRHWLIIRGLAGATSLYFRYWALHYMSIADATVIALSMPVFVCIFARIFLKEPFGLFHVLALFLTLIGITFTSKIAFIFVSSEEDNIKTEDDNRKRMIGLIISLGATIIGSSIYVIIRKIKGLHHSVILFNFAWVAIVESSIITYAFDGFKLPNCGIAPWMLCLLSVFSFYGQLLLTKSLQHEEAGLVSVTRASSEVLFAFIFQIIIFRDIPDGWSILGALLVTSAVLLTLSRKWVLTLPTASRVRKALNFVTK